VQNIADVSTCKFGNVIGIDKFVKPGTDMAADDNEFGELDIRKRRSVSDCRSRQPCWQSSAITTRTLSPPSLSDSD